VLKLFQQKRNSFPLFFLEKWRKLSIKQAKKKGGKEAGREYDLRMKESYQLMAVS